MATAMVYKGKNKKRLPRYFRGNRNKPLKRSIKYLLRSTLRSPELHRAGDSDEMCCGYIERCCGFNVQVIDYLTNPNSLFPAVTCNMGRSENNTSVSWAPLHGKWSMMSFLLPFINVGVA